jgi:hypothetical protein
MALILVLGLIAMTLGVSYAMVRTQTAGVRVSTNGRLTEDARQAAFSGLSLGMRRISQTSWGGVGTTITGTIGVNESYSVSFVTGDAMLTTSAPDADDWPYRVTITSTGYAVDPTASSVTTTYKVEGVVQLVPMQMTSNPAMWNTMLNYVYYQTTTNGNAVQFPVSIKGPQRWNGGLTSFLSNNPNTAAQRSRYLGDLNAMRTNGYGDFRPFSGPITTSNGAMTTTNRTLLTSTLGLTLTNAAPTTVTSWSHPGTVSTYKLYPGGQSYNVPTLGGTISGTTYQADPRTNPAGIFFRSGDLTVGNNTTVVGTVISTGNVIVSGTNVSMMPFSLAPVSGTNSTPQLPAIVASSGVQVTGGANAVVRGTVAAFGDFIAPTGSQTTRFDLQGNLIADALDIQDRSEWNTNHGQWNSNYNAFTSQFLIPYYPVYAQLFMGLNYTPLLTISAGTGSVTRQWFTSGSPIYAVGSGDPGLKWSVLRITELR